MSRLLRKELIEELLEKMQIDGFLPGTEQYDVCEQAIRYVGYSYLRTEELANAQTIDCSTLISQSFWEGAAIGVPFIAESQRIATSGESIASPDDLIPSDVLVKFGSLLESPDKTYNHVGLYLGTDKDGVPWLIESAGGKGVVLTPVKEFDAKGGIKRFSLSRKVFSGQETKKSLALTKLVPKFGRLGVRQHLHDSTERPQHRGIDIYLDQGTEVRSTMSGILSFSFDPVEQSTIIEVNARSLSVRFMHVEPKSGLISGQRIRRGQIIGRIIPPSRDSKIKYSEFKGASTHLHLEVRRLLSKGESEKGKTVIDGYVHQNHLYLSKKNELALPC